MSDPQVPASVPNFFVAGGTVPQGSPSYVEREADHELYESLRSGEYCFVLNSRQMGKSSLAVRTMARLAEEGIRCAFVDLTRLGGSTVTPDQWYSGLLVESGRALGIRTEAAKYLRDNRDLGPAQRFLGFLQEIALVEILDPVVLMIDEIDAVRSLPFSSDELFAGIRQLHNARATNPASTRLTVCLLGAALPSDLISDPRSTPFNIGKRIGLLDFTPNEVAPLADGLGVRGSAILDRVMYWTSGHPFLTQVLCAEIASRPNPQVADVDRLVRERYLDARARETDTNLADVANRLLGRGDPAVTDVQRADTLSLYSKLARGIDDDEANSAVARIKMSGVARLDGGRLVPRNRIYSEAFNLAWIRENMPGQEMLRQRRAYWSGAFRASLGAGVLIAAIGILLAIALRNAGEARAAQRKAVAAERAQERLAASEAESKVDALHAAQDVRKSLIREQAAEHRALVSAEQERKALVLAQTSEKSERQAQAQANRDANLARSSEAETKRLLYASNMGLAAGALAYGSGIQAGAYLTDNAYASRGANKVGWEYRYFQALLHEALEYPKLSAGIRKVAFSPNGNLLTMCADHALFAWDPDRPKLLASIISSKIPSAGDIALSGNGKVVVLAKTDGTIEVRSPEDFSVSKRLRGIGQFVRQLDLSNDGSRLSGLFRLRERIMDLRTGSVDPPRTPDVGRTRMALLPDHEGIEPRNEGLVRRRFGDPSDAGVVWSCPGRHNTQRSFAVSGDGRYAAFADSWGYAQLVDARSGRWIGKPLVQTAMITAMAFDPESSFLVTGSDDGVIRMTSLTDGATLRTFRARQGHITTLAVATDGRIGYGTMDGFSGVFSPKSFARPSGVANLSRTTLSGMAVSSDGKWLATAGLGDKAFRIVDAHTGAVKAVFPTEFPEDSVDFSPDNNFVAVAGGTRRTVAGACFAEVVDLRTRRRTPLKVAPMPLLGIKFSPDGNRVVVYEGNNLLEVFSAPASVQLFDAKSGRLLGSAHQYPGLIPEVAFSPNGNLLAVPHNSGKIYILNAANLKELAFLDVDRRHSAGPEGDACMAACFTSDGRRLLVGRSSGVVDVYDLASHRRVDGWVAHSSRVTGIAYAPGGRTLITVSDDRHAKFWTPDTWRSLGDLLYPTQVVQMAVSKGDDTVYLGVGDGVVHAMRTVGFPPAQPVNIQDGETLDWNVVLARSKRVGRPILVAIFGEGGLFDSVYREFLESPEVRGILARHFLVVDPQSTAGVKQNGRTVPALAFFRERFNFGPGTPRTRIIRSDGATIWDGKLVSPQGDRDEVGVPPAAWEIVGYVRELAKVAPRMSQRQQERLRRYLQETTSPTVRFSAEPDEPNLTSGIGYSQFLAQGDLSSALHEADNLISSAPTAAYPHLYRGIVLCAMERWHEAADEIQRNSGIVRPAIDLHFWQMMGALVFADDHEEYHRRFQSVVDPDWELSRIDALKLECLGFGLVPGTHDPEMAARAIQKRFATELADPTQLGPRTFFSLVLARAGRLEEAENLLRQTLGSPLMSPTDRTLMEERHIFLSLVLALRGDKSDALREYERAELAIGKKNSDGQLMSAGESRAIYAVVRREAKKLLSL